MKVQAAIAVAILASGAGRAQETSAAPQARGVRTIQDASAALEADRRRGARMAVPEGDIGRWFGPDEYPAEAQRAGEQGRVVARLAIAADGRVSDCVVQEASGSASLDRRTCEIALTRLSFRAPRDRRGRPLSSTYLLPVRWVLPTDDVTLEPLQAGNAADFAVDQTVEYRVDGAGKLISCQVVSGQAPKAQPADPCAGVRVGQQIAQGWQRDGRPVGARITRRTIQSVTIDP